MSTGIADPGDDYGDLAFFGGTDVTVQRSRFNAGGASVSISGVKHAVIANNELRGDPANVWAMGVYIMRDAEDVVVLENDVSGFANEAVVVTNIGNTGDPTAVSRNIRGARQQDPQMRVRRHCSGSRRRGRHHPRQRHRQHHHSATARNHGYRSADAESAGQQGARAVGRVRRRPERLHGLRGGRQHALRLVRQRSTVSHQNSHDTVDKNNLTVPAAKVGTLIYPKASDDHLDLAANRIIGLIASAQLFNCTTSNNLTRSTISRNKLTLGSVSLPFNKVVVVTENIFTTVTGAIVDNGGCVIANNPGLPA
ncbi:hypothetical protein V6S67_05010 [Arthrobacter sp. Soc17.1.1.1]|uniref:hypothetical protein n=1 Tax=Arthrobacter sp. Soc17.1.1.1 TaxID=3121277 RepID=UPI002FE47ED1